MQRSPSASVTVSGTKDQGRGCGADVPTARNMLAHSRRRRRYFFTKNMNGLSRKENELYKLAGRHIGEHTHTPNYLTIVGADPDLDPLNPVKSSIQLRDHRCEERHIQVPLLQKRHGLDFYQLVDKWLSSVTRFPSTVACVAMLMIGDCS